MTVPPTLAQQRGLAFAPMPFAVISFGSSAFVIYHLLFKRREKLTRMYHRLILMMNVGLVVYSFVYVWGPFAVPEGTPNYVGASGTIQTCEASGFLWAMFALNVPIYYASLSLQAFMGIRNNFNENQYRWIEKWVHLVAYCFPVAIASVPLATNNFNPSGNGCWISKAPRGCESDPDVPCTRGEDIRNFELIVGLSLVAIYFVFPPSVMMSMYCWIKKVEQSVEGSIGMQRIRQLARKEMLQNVARQMSLYLLSFWSTWILNLAAGSYQTLSGGQILYNLNIVGHCILSSQGWIFALVYFTLERMGAPKVASSISISPGRPVRRSLRTTVAEIQMSAAKKSANGAHDSATSSKRSVSSSRRSSFVFNIFDGTPDSESPWAKFINDDYGEDSDEECTSEADAGVQTRSNEDHHI